MRYFNLAVLLAVIAVVAMAGFRGHHFRQPPFEVFPDMNYQPKVKDQAPSAFFADGMGARQPVDGTVAEEMPAVMDYWATGKFDGGHWGDGIPVHAAKGEDPALGATGFDIARGRERYAINCAVCHGAAGDGKGITSQYGINATSYQSDRIRTMNDGEIFNTITNGKGQMMGYGYNIAIDDRWRIIEYVRALQHAQNAKLEEASPQEQAQLNGSKNKSASITKPLKFRQFSVTYLGQFTVASWYDSLDMMPSGITSTFNVPFAPMSSAAKMRYRGVKIDYLNQKTARGWNDADTLEQPMGK